MYKNILFPIRSHTHTLEFFKVNSSRSLDFSMLFVIGLINICALIGYLDLLIPQEHSKTFYFVLIVFHLVLYLHSAIYVF